MFSAGYFSDFLSARKVESRPMNPNQKRLLKYNSMGLPGTWAQSCMGSFVLLLPLFFFPNFWISIFFYLFIAWKWWKIGLRKWYSFIAGHQIHEWCPCIESYFFTTFLLFYPHIFVCYPYVARMYSYVTRWLPLCTRMYSYVIGVYPYVLVCSRMLLVCSRVVF